MSPSRPQRGIGLLEVIISTLLIGLLVVVSMRTLTMARLTHRQTAGLSTATDLAQELLSEVLAQAYEEPGGGSTSLGADSGEVSRNRYDDVDDYHGYRSTPVSREGTPIDGFEGWTREVRVEYVDLGSISTATGTSPTGTSISATIETSSSTTDAGLKRITVSVSNADGVQAELSGVRSRRGVLEQPVPVTTETVVWIGATLSLDDNNDDNADRPAERMGVHLPNLVPNPNLP